MGQKDEGIRKEGKEGGRWRETGREGGRERKMEGNIREKGRREGWACVGDTVIIIFSKRV